MITRVWQGWTRPENADAYEALLMNSIFPTIRAQTSGVMGDIQLLRRELADETEFMTLLDFQSAEALHSLVGQHDTRAFVPPSALRVLERYEADARHFTKRDFLTFEQET